uniref:NADH:ubiquinone oxidoreductase complex assembly factor 2 n=1 Tax=Leptobrachium leishanense TaxID=445787 RepID=A0A8C5MJR9_9ANUR
MDKLRTLLQRTLGRVRHHVGTDQLGNKYYVIPEHTSWTGQKSRARRTVECVNTKVFEYQFGDIPVEWEAWIRGKRKDPPTLEEILKNETLREETKTKGDLLKLEEGAVDQPKQNLIKGHASSNVYGGKKPSEEPISTGNTFEPGSWTPGQQTKEK